MVKAHPISSKIALLSSLIAMILALALCAGCSYESYELGEPENTGDAGTSWTVLMYMCGSDLESEAGLATENLIELTGSELGDNVNFVIETGGTSKWRNNVITTDEIGRYVAEPEGIAYVGSATFGSMGDPSTLADFITWGVKNYPADRTMLVFWDHGGGTLAGVCADELYVNKKTGATDTLTLPEMAKALKKANHHFDLVGFDTCLMATLETAQTVEPWADYLVASEESEPGGGWAYDSWPAWLAKYPGVETKELGRAICDSYYYKCVNSYTDEMATLSVTDLSKVPALAKAFEDASDEIFASTSDMQSLRVIAQGASRAENYGGNTDAQGYTDMVDLGHLMKNTDSVLSPHAGAVIAALDDAVVYSINGRDRSNAHGLSVFYPLAWNSDVYNMYQDITTEITGNFSYLKYLAVKNGNYNKVDWKKLGAETKAEEKVKPVEKGDFKIKYKQGIDSDMHLRLTITNDLDAVESVRFAMGRFDLDDSLYLPFGVDNNINMDWDEGVFTDNFEGTWMAIDGNFVNAQLVAETDDYTLYAIPIKLNDKRTNLIAAWRYDENRFDVLGAYDSVDETSGQVPKSMRKLQEGDQVTFLFTAYDLGSDDDEGIEFDLSTITWKNDLVMEDTDLGDGDYVYWYEIVDILGNVTQTKPVIMHYQDGYIEPEEL